MMRHFSHIELYVLISSSLGVFGGLNANAQELSPSYDVTCNANGYVLTPKPSAQRQSSGSKFLQSKLYLGVSCDAYAKNLGDGAWCWTNAGVLTEFGGETFPLKSYELPACRQHPDSSACGCWDAPLPNAPSAAN